MAGLVLAGSVSQARDFTSAAQGTTGAQFLELAVGARAVGMGEAYSAVTDDAASLYWNPAGLTAIQKRSATFMHAAYIESSYFDYAAYGQNLGPTGAVGAAIQYHSAGSLSQLDASGNPAGSFTPYDLAVTLGYAYKFSGGAIGALDGFSAGLGIKYIRSEILSAAQTEAVDVGIMSPKYLDKRLNFAFTASNIGGTIRFDAQRQNLPLVLRLGSAYQLSERFLGTMDVSFPRNNNPYVALGTEYGFVARGPWKAAARAGFNSQTVGSFEGFTGVYMGLGLGYELMTLDYAFEPLGGVGQSHRMSLSFNF
jgi:hypothetical protein